MSTLVSEPRPSAEGEEVKMAYFRACRESAAEDNVAECEVQSENVHLVLKEIVVERERQVCG